MFPAYARLDTGSACVENDTKKYCDDLPEWCGSPGAECALLASDSEDERPAKVASVPTAPRALSPYTCERRGERSNRSMSTLYCPARPQYCPRSLRTALGAARVQDRTKRRRWPRYHAAPAADPTVGPDADGPERRALAFRRALADSPLDEELWHRYIDYQELCGGDADSLEAARAACERLPRSCSLEERLYDAAQRALPAREYLSLIRGRLSGGAGVWARLLTALACGAAGAAGLADTVYGTAVAAVQATRADPAAYPLLLYVYGSFLRSAGHMEELTQLIELVAAMSLPGAADGFPPPRPPERERRLEDELAAFELRATSGGLPRGEVWARVERARAAAHWRPASRPDPADPARLPPADRAAALLQPVVAPHAVARLARTLLRLAGVPRLPARGRVWGRGCDCGWPSADGAALSSLLFASRRLAPAHPARASAKEARALLAMMPRGPSDDADGYGEWVEALWEACLAGGVGGVGLLCWRLRELHLRILLAGEGEEGKAAVRRARSQAKEALRRHAGGASLPYAVFAKLERAAAGRERALVAASLALRAAKEESEKMYAARVVGEVAAQGGEVPEEGRKAMMAAVGGGGGGGGGLRRCEERCHQLEASWEGPREGGETESEEDELPGVWEWGAARVVLASPARRAELQRELLSAAPHWIYRGGESARYAETCACALAARLHGGEAARLAARLLPLMPGNGYLALLAGGAPLWALEGGPRRLVSGEGATARLLVAALAAEREGWHAAGPRVHRAGRRAARAAGAGDVGGGRCAGGAALLSLCLSAGASVGASAGALAAALEAAPHARALYVLGAAAVPAEATALPDLMLDRGLRLHALPDELDGL